MRVLVTGSSGFIGSHVVDALAGVASQVRGLDRVPAASSPASRGVLDVDVWRGDVGDQGVLDACLAGVDVVCHQAAKVGLGVDAQDLPGYAADNTLATAGLLAAMDRASVRRLVLASSMVVYGEGRYRCPEHGVMPAPPRREELLASGVFDPACTRCGSTLLPELVDEDDPLDPRNGYAATKLSQEHLAASWARQTGSTAVALRYHNVYGPRMPRNTPYAGVASIFRSALAHGEAPQVFEDGAQRRDFVHVRDVARANLAAIAQVYDGAAPPGELRAYNVGSGWVSTVLDLANSLAEALGGPAPVVTGQYRLGDVRHITASSQRIADELGWRADITLAEGMAELAAGA